MRNGFEAVIAALWASLGLAAPRIDPEGMVLRIDGRAVRLAPTPDQDGILISARAGTLSADPHRAEAQARALLRDGLGLILTGRTAVRLDGADRTIVVEALGRCSVEEVQTLRELIEDVLFRIDVHAETLMVAGPTPAQTSSASVRLDDDNLIFLA